MQKDKMKNKKSAGEGITEFVQKNRKLIFVVTIILVLSFIISIITIYLFDVSRKKAILAVEELGIRYEALMEKINELPGEIEDIEDLEENEDIEDIDGTENTIEITQNDKNDEIEKETNELLMELETFAKNNSGYAGGRAWWLIGNIYTMKKDWENAETAWVSSAETAAKTYLAPIAYFRAGTVSEQQGKIEKAIEHYSNSLSTLESFPDAQRAMFSIGRLNESLGDYEAAKIAYNDLVVNNKYETPWVNMAQSRLITLEIIEQSLSIEDYEDINDNE